MTIFDDYLAKLEDPKIRQHMEDVLAWVQEEFVSLTPKIAWNQPMFTDHGTFIIGFSVAKQHMAVAPEQAGILHFTDAIRAAGYEYTKQLIRMRWDCPVNYTLLKRIIQYNITDKADCTTFWRK